MKRQQRVAQDKQRQEIKPSQVWQALAAVQQRQFMQAVEAICQRLANRRTNQREGHNANK